MKKQHLLGNIFSLQVFLQHLTPLLSLSTFTALWLTILEFMDKYMHADRSDLLVSPLHQYENNIFSKGNISFREPKSLEI